MRIYPSKADGEMLCPPSKSMAHRNLICAALTEGQSIIRIVDFSEDIKATLSCIKELYAIRWSQETAFRHLKYAGNMVHIHSLKKEFLIQEIYGKLTLYNFSAWLSTTVRLKEKNVKHEYVVNHTQMQKICIRFLRGVVRDVKALISRYLVPVRPGRKFERCLRRQSADTLAYR